MSKPFSASGAADQPAHTTNKESKGIVKVEKKGLRVMRAEALKEFLDGHD